MPNHRRAIPANRTAGVDQKYLDERNKRKLKKPPEGPDVPVAQYIVLRRSARIKARSCNIRNQAQTITSSEASKTSNETQEALQEFNFQLRMLQLLDVEGSDAKCLDNCYICNMGCEEYDSLANLKVSELLPSVSFYEDKGEEELGSNWLTTYSDTGPTRKHQNYKKRS